jgi:hypothetical protein
MRERTSKQLGRKRSGKAANLAEQPGPPSGYVLDTELVADAARKRMAEYCQRAAAQFSPMEIAQPLVHQGELYLPGVF